MRGGQRLAAPFPRGPKVNGWAARVSASLGKSFAVALGSGFAPSPPKWPLDGPPHGLGVRPRQPARSRPPFPPGVASGVGIDGTSLRIVGMPWFVSIAGAWVTERHPVQG